MRRVARYTLFSPSKHGIAMIFRYHRALSLAGRYQRLCCNLFDLITN